MRERNLAYFVDKQCSAVSQLKSLDAIPESARK